MRTLLACLVTLSACTGIQRTQIFSGAQRPVAGACDAPSRATLTLRGQAVIVSPADGTLTLTGSAVGNNISASTTLSGADKKPYPITLSGQRNGARIEASLVTPRCRYALTLDQTQD